MQNKVFITTVCAVNVFWRLLDLTNTSLGTIPVRMRAMLRKRAQVCYYRPCTCTQLLLRVCS